MEKKTRDILLISLLAFGVICWGVYVWREQVKSDYIASCGAESVTVCEAMAPCINWIPIGYDEKCALIRGFAEVFTE